MYIKLIKIRENFHMIFLLSNIGLFVNFEITYKFAVKYVINIKKATNIIFFI